MWSLFTSQADVFEKYCLRENQEVLPRSVLESSFRSLGMGTSNEKSSASAVQAVTSRPSVAHLAVIKMQTPRTSKRSKTSTRPSLHTLTTSCFRSLFSTVSSLLSLTTVSCPCAGLLSVFFRQASEIKIDSTSRAAHLFSTSSTSVRSTAATATCQKARLFHFSCKSPLFWGDLHTFSSCSIPKKSIW